MAKRQVIIHAGPLTGFGLPVQEGLIRFARTRPNWRIRPANETSRLQGALAWKPHGFLGGFGLEQLRAKLAGSGAAVVDLMHGDEPVTVPAVFSDERAIGRMAAEHLIGNRLDRLVVIGRAGSPYAAERRSGFEAHAVHSGASCQFVDLAPLEGKPKKVAGAIGAFDRPFAVFAADDNLAQNVLDAAHLCGLRIPDDMAVVGVNDSIFCPFSDPPLSSVRPDWQRIGFEGAALLDRLMDGAEPPQTPILVPPLGVSVRRSSDMLAIDDTEVAQAVRWIRDHAAEAVTVDDLLRAVPVARRSLERKFRSYVGRSPWQEIRRVQIEHVKRLLIETDWPMPRIAAQSAFRDINHLGGEFRKHAGMPPTAYRKQHRA